MDFEPGQRSGERWNRFVDNILARDQLAGSVFDVGDGTETVMFQFENEIGIVEWGGDFGRWNPYKDRVISRVSY